MGGWSTWCRTRRSPRTARSCAHISVSRAEETMTIDRSIPRLVLASVGIFAAFSCKKQEAPSGTTSAPAANTATGTAPTANPTSGAAPAAGGGDKIRIGVLNDMSGLYSDLSGKGSVVAAQMAVDELGGKVAGLPVEIVS